MSFLGSAVGGAFCAEHPGEAPVTAPTVISVVQLTHDGVGKTGLLSDDANLYVTEWPAAGHIVAKFSLQGVERSLIPSAFSNLKALDISPDRSSLLVAPLQGSGEREFWSLPVKTGSPHRLGELTGRDAAWSADGQQVAFSKGPVLYVAPTTGDGAHAIYTADGSVFAPYFSHEGKRVRFTISAPGSNSTAIWEVGVDGSNPHPLLDGWQHASKACCGRWTTDGRYYIFQVTETYPLALTTLWALSDGGVDKPSPMQLTSGPISFANAAVARDNKQMWAIGVQPTTEVVKYDPKQKKFISMLPGVSATDMEFSSDGKWVTYITVPDRTLWTSRADGSECRQLTSVPNLAALPHWSPDGNQIAYVSLQPGKPWRISIVSRQGGTPQDVLDESQGQNDANWSADGSRIMFGHLTSDATNISVVDLKTHAVTTIPGSQGLFSPRWSPDGRYIAALTTNFTTVKLFDYSTQKWSDWITDAAGAVSYPVWSADSKYLYFDDSVTAEESIRRVKVGSTAPELVFNVEGLDRFLGPFGPWSGRTPDGSSMFVQDRSTQEVYQLSVVLP